MIQDKLEENIVLLSEENVVFNDHLRALQTNHELVRLQARQLGYYRKDESVIRFSNVKHIGPRL